MKETLLDIVQYTHSLGVIDLVRVDGTQTETKITAISDENRSVIIFGKFKTPEPEFLGTFGMPNLSKLKTILSFTDYDENAKINVSRTTRDAESIPTTIHFETKTSDFVNDYRLMAKVIIEDKVKTITFKGTTWSVEFDPTIAGIQRLKKQASANSEEVHFTPKTDGNDLKIFFGDPSTHSGNFVFQSDVTGTLSGKWSWPVKVFLSIMDLPGDKTVKFSDSGVAEVTLDSGLAEYKFLLPALASK